MRSTMMNVPLSLNHLLERAGKLFGGNEIVSRLPDKTLKRHSFAQYYRRTRALGSALQALGLNKGDRVATLCWNHHAHLECYFGIPAAGGVMHTLNLRLAPEDAVEIWLDSPRVSRRHARFVVDERSVIRPAWSHVYAMKSSSYLGFFFGSSWNTTG